jgi:hypothetical protein
MAARHEPTNRLAAVGLFLPSLAISYWMIRMAKSRSSRDKILIHFVGFKGSAMLAALSIRPGELAWGAPVMAKTAA